MVVEKLISRHAAVLNIEMGARGWTPTACLKLVIGGVERRAFSIPQTTVAPQTPLDLREVQLATLGFSKPCVGQSEQFLQEDAATVAHQVAPHGNVAVL